MLYHCITRDRSICVLWLARGLRADRRLGCYALANVCGIAKVRLDIRGNARSWAWGAHVMGLVSAEAPGSNIVPLRVA
jgi:hypothetical protein